MRERCGAPMARACSSIIILTLLLGASETTAQTTLKGGVRIDEPQPPPSNQPSDDPCAGLDRARCRSLPTQTEPGGNNTCNVPYQGWQFVGRRGNLCYWYIPLPQG